MPLLRSRRFAPLLLCQTLGAFNDNLFKNALVVMVLFAAGSDGGAALVAAAGGIFILPYVVLSATAGQIADKWEKSRTIAAVKCAEVALMALAAAGFWLNSMPVLFAVLFGLGVQATFFSPLKYAILPDHLRDTELVAGNGLIEAGTFIGILLGTVAGGAAIVLPQGALIVSAAGVAVAVAGVAAALLIPRTAAGDPALRIGRNPVRETAALLRSARANRPVWLCLLGLSWFWSIGATLLAELPTAVRDDLHADAPVVTLLLAFFTVGVGGGSVLCNRLLRGAVSARLVPLAALGLSVFLADFTVAVRHGAGLSTVAAMLHAPAGWRMLADLLLLAACGGLYSVPLYAIIQERSAPAERARMIGANNVVNAIAMAAGAALTAGLALVGVAPVTVLLLFAVANLFVAAWIVRLLPQEVLRGLFRFYFERFHGVDLRGMEHLDAPDPRAVVVVNHQSFLDGCFVAAFMPGSPMFAINVHTAHHWWARLGTLVVRSFLVDPANPFATKSMVAAVRGGERLVVFPEGRITVTGGLMKVYEGAALVADKAGVPVIAVHIGGLRQTHFSRMKGKLPLRWFPRLSMTVSPPVMLGNDAATGRDRREAVGKALQAVMERAAFETGAPARSLWSALLDARVRFGGKMALIEDTARAPIGYDRLVLGAAVLGRRVAQEVPAGGAVGVLLPNANGAAVTFFALQAFGLVPAMLNYTAGAEGMRAACTAAGVRTVLTSRAFVEKAKLEEVVARLGQHVRIVWLEELRAGLGVRDKARGWWDARRARRLPGAAADPHGPGAILFTSGSEGTPKGVVLSHANMVANIDQASAMFAYSSADKVFNAMPVFHSFGLTAGLLLPVLRGVPVFLYPSPLHYKIVPTMIYDTDSTMLFATDTFLTGWARHADPYDFRSVRAVFSGAEKLRPETRLLYAERFGVRVFEGYGVTETSPVLALNTPMHCRPGSVGRLVPGTEWRLDPVEGIEGGGRLVVRGPNVMLGYLRTERPGVLEAPEGGWYDTGDICAVDADGFVSILARAKRFAKIAGEMVSMPAAEALAYAVWPGAAHAVVSVPDKRKGEALVLLTTQADAAAASLLAEARSRSVPEIAVPRTIRVVDALPVMASGKVDYPQATRMAAADGEKEAA